MGNRLTKEVNSQTETYTYVTGTNKIQEITGPVTYTYDANGNIAGIGSKVLTYNQNNRLIRVEEDSTVLGEYTYNGMGQRVIKTAGGVTTVFHYDFRGRIIGESDQDENFNYEFLYKGGSRLALVDVASGEIHSFLNDRLGTPQMLADSTNTVVWEGIYKPFGEAEVNPNSSVVNNFRFPGQYYDEETGFHYNYHRYYDPGTGRFLTPDPSMNLNYSANIPFVYFQLLETPQDLNFYSYVGNSPANFIDPIGLLKDCGSGEKKVINKTKLIGCLSTRGPKIITLGAACAAAIKIPAPLIVKIPAIIGTCGLTAALVADCVLKSYDCEKIKQSTCEEN